MEGLPAADIDAGRFKYVLIKLYHGDKERYLCRGYLHKPFHADVYESN